MKFISLFAGVGGFDLGLERAGHECLAQCEIDDRARAVLEKHWPEGIIRHDDITTFDGRAFRGRVDLVCGGFPCQDLSVAGKRRGLSGERSGLYWELLRVVGEVQPRVCLLENVPGLLSSNEGRDFAEALDGLRKCGYVGCYRILDSRWFGVPQRRRRVFIVAVRDTRGSGSREAAEVLALAQSLCGDPAPSKKQGQDIAGTLEDRTRAGGVIPIDESAFNQGENAQYNPQIGGDVAPTLRNSRAHAIGFDSEGSANQQAYEEEIGPTRGQNGGGGAVAFAQNQRDEVRDLKDCAGALASKPGMKQQTFIAGTLSASGAGTSRPAGQANEPDFMIPVEVKQEVFHDQAGALAAGDGSGWNGNASSENGSKFVEVKQHDLSDTLSVGANQTTGRPGYICNEGVVVRRLTPTECERLQGFPDGWTEGQSDAQRYKQMGNAVTVNVIEWLGNRLKRIYD